MAKQILPEGKYKVVAVGPSADKSFQGDNGPVSFTVTSVQLEGHESLWVEVNTGTGKPKPAVGEELEGHVEQDDAGKYLPKFKKKRGAYGGGGGGRTTPGAIWSAAFETASVIVAGYLSVAPEAKRKKAAASIDQYLTLVELVAPRVKDLVDAHAGETTKPEGETQKSESESGESPAPAAPAAEKEGDVVIEDIDESELENW